MRVASERLRRLTGATFAVAAVCTMVNLMSVSTAQGAIPTNTYDRAVQGQAPLGYWLWGARSRVWVADQR